MGVTDATQWYDAQGGETTNYIDDTDAKNAIIQTYSDFESADTTLQANITAIDTAYKAADTAIDTAYKAADTAAAQTPWLTVQSSQVTGVGTWSYVSGWSGAQAGGFTAGGTNLFVPKAGLYRVSVRAYPNAATRLLVALDRDGVGIQTNQSQRLFDKYSSAASEMTHGSKLEFITSYFTIYVYATVNNTTVVYVQAEYVGSINAVSI